MTTNGTYIINGVNGTNGVHDPKETNDTCLDVTRRENIFNRLKSLSSRKSYSSLYNYMKSVIQEMTPEQPFYVLDLADILWKMQLWREKFPGITPFYAVKANPDPILVRLFCMLGFSFDCSTKGEIQMILENGGKPQNIIYAHTVKPHSSLQYASKVGVDFMTFDSEEELRKIKKYFPLARLVLRVKAESTQGFYDLNQKYGIQVSEAEKLLHIAKELEMNIIGVSFHVGALCKNPKCYTKTIENCRLIFDIAEKLGFSFTVLDLGAGFFGSYQREKYFDKVATEIKGALKEYFSGKNIRIIAEPGCFYVASAQRSVTCVLGRKATQQNNSIVNGNNNDNEANEVERHYFINDGIYGSFFEHIDIYDVIPKPLVDPRELAKRPVYKSKIWGQTCCSEDVVLKSTPMPELEYGEYLVWENMGAYSQGLCSTFTVVPLPTERRVFVKNSRLNFDWIENLDEVLEFLAKHVDLIENEGFP